MSYRYKLLFFYPLFSFLLIIDFTINILIYRDDNYFFFKLTFFIKF